MTLNKITTGILSLRRCHATPFALALFLASCDGAPESVVEGLARPTALQPSDVHVIGTSESIAVVEDLEVLSDGTVWVLNSVEPLFVGFGPDGEVVSEHGIRGGGPEEFRAPVGFVSGRVDDEAWILDVRRHAMIEVSKAPTEWSEISIPTDSIPPGTLKGGMNLLESEVRTARFGDEIVLARSFGTIASGMLQFWLSTWGADLVALDPASASVRNIVDLGEALGDPTDDLEQTRGFPPFPLWFRLWAVCSDSEIRAYDRPGNQIRTFAHDGTELDATPLPPSRLTEVSDRQFARAVFGLILAERLGDVRGGVSAADSARLLNEMVEGVEGNPAQLASFLPRYVDFRCAEDGSVWIQPFDPDVGGMKGGPAWLRVRRDGETDELRFPDGFDPYRFTSDRVWGVQRDEFDIASIGWIAVP